MKVIVFLGPSLGLDDAKKILPNAMYLPPASCGDVLHVTRLKPDIIVIIDGFFEKKASILHKEILFALESGIAVYGASSMGALRARECMSFGMIGMGKIYEKYFVNCNEDDAVAILHAYEVNSYASGTIALVDVLATLEKAVLDNIIDSVSASLFKQSARELFYIYRNLENILNKSTQVSSSQLTTFKNWIEQNGWVNQKKQDAITLLQNIAINSVHKRTKFNFHRSLFFRTHYKNAMCEPFPFDHKDLPPAEKFAIQMKKNGIIYRQLRRIAYLLSICFALAKKNLDGIDWKKIDTSQKRFRVIEKLMYAHVRSSHNFYLHSLMRLSSEKEYQYYREKVISENNVMQIFYEDSPVKFRVFELCAKLWACVEHFISDYDPHPKFVQIYSDKFRLKQQLFTSHDTIVWLQKNDLDIPAYQKLMTKAVRFNYVVMQNNLEVLGLIDDEENIGWFLDAVQLTGVSA